jgi:predicted membrane protein
MNRLVRVLSLSAAGLFSLMVLVDPYLLAGVPSWRLHTGLPVMMLGGAGLFMYGLGFVPRTAAIRTVFHPATAWTLFIAGAAVTAGVTTGIVGSGQ